MVNSRFDSETTYKAYTKGSTQYIEIRRNDEKMSIKMRCLDNYKNVFIPEIYTELCEIRDKYGDKICPVCGAHFVAFTKRKYCGNECALKANNEKNKSRYREKAQENEKPKEKHVSQLTELTREARAKGMSYGQLQAQKYLEQMKGAVI